MQKFQSTKSWEATLCNVPGHAVGSAAPTFVKRDAYFPAAPPVFLLRILRRLLHLPRSQPPHHSWSQDLPVLMEYADCQDQTDPEDVPDV